MNEQLQFVFDSNDWYHIIPSSFQARYMQIEQWCTEKETEAFYCNSEDEELKEAFLSKRVRLLEAFQTQGLMV